MLVKLSLRCTPGIKAVNRLVLI